MPQFIFEGHRLDTERRELRRGSEQVALEPQVFDLIAYLVKNRDRVLSKDDLFAAVWDGRIVSDSTLTSRINSARKAVGDTGGEQRLIRTYARKGIRFVGEVQETTELSSPEPEAQGVCSPLAESRGKPCVAVLPFDN
ncbi:MAG: transcriptional regulator, partial [Pseudolabrys sp.]